MPGNAVIRRIREQMRESPEIKLTAYQALHEHLFREPWMWLGLTRIQWLKCPHHRRVLLF